MASRPYDWSGFKAPETMPAAMSQCLAAEPRHGGAGLQQDRQRPGRLYRGADPRRGRTVDRRRKRAAGACRSQTLGGGGRSPFQPSRSDRAPCRRTCSGRRRASAAARGGASTWGLKDASGKLYRQGDPLTYQAADRRNDRRLRRRFLQQVQAERARLLHAAGRRPVQEGQGAGDLRAWTVRQPTLQRRQHAGRRFGQAERHQRSRGALPGRHRGGRSALQVGTERAEGDLPALRHRRPGGRAPTSRSPRCATSRSSSRTSPR